MNRVAAIQKSSRTMTMHCTRSPSHCRRACTSSVFCFLPLGVQPLLELVQDDQHLLARRQALAPAQRRQRLLQAQVAGQAGTALPQPVQQPGLGLLGGRLDVDGDHVARTAGAAARP